VDPLKRIALVVVLLASAAHADPGAGSAAPDAEVVNVKPDSGWFDRRVSAISVAAVYGVAGTWAYFAWFNGAHTKPFFWQTPSWAYEQPFSLKDYAGGADKWGHGWANYALVRGTTELLAAGGWPKLQSSLVAGGIAETLFAMQETKDGHIWGFEVGDMAMDVLGAAFAVAMENIPALDRAIDFRMSWVPSSDFRKLWAQHPWQRGDGVDFTQDYTGMTFQLAVHLAPLANTAEELWWTQWVDVVGGFEAKGFEPTQMPMRFTPYQDFYLGVGVNLQAIIDHTLTGKVRTFGHGFTEVFAVPGQVLRLGEERRTR
jgi:hypothetical protein